MTISTGPKFGQIISGAPGDPHFAQLLKFFRSYEALVQPTVKSRIAAVPTSGMVNGDCYLLTAAPNKDAIARYYSDTNVSTPTGWEYFTPFDGMTVWSTADQNPYRYKLVGGSLAWAVETTGGGGSGGTTQTVAISSNTLALAAVTADTILTSLNQNITTITLPAGVAGTRKDLIIRFTQDVTGGRTVAGWPGVSWEGGSAPAIASAANAVTVIVLSNFDNTGWYGFVDSGLTVVSGVVDVPGNVNFTGTGRRITGEMSSPLGSLASRVAVQSSTVNGQTQLMVLPNGTATTAGVNLHNTADPENGGHAIIQMLSNSLYIAASRTGTGAFQPIDFYTSDVVRFSLAVAGGLQLSTPLRLNQYTLATLPSAAAFSGHLIEVTDATGGPKTCRSNGSVWQILNTTTTVS